MNRFDRLIKEAGISDIDGTKPVPKVGRRFWYNAYSSAQERVLEQFGEIAAEQGSANAEAVFQNYIAPKQRREPQRVYIREGLSKAFGTA